MAATLVTLGWLPAARADDGNAQPTRASQPSSSQGWTPKLRRTAGPASGIVGTDTVSSSAQTPAQAAQQRRRLNPLSRFDWGDLGLPDNAPGGTNVQAAADVPRAAAAPRSKAMSAITPVQALMPANDSSGIGPASSGVAPDVTDTAADEPRQLEPAAPGEERVAQLPLGPKVPAFEDTFGQGPQSLEVNCDVERQKLKPINAVTNKITAEPGAFPPECGIGELTFKTRDFSPMTYTWIASNLCHKPLYFEQPRLERYGHSLPPVIQPVASAVLFYLSVPLLPYKMGIEPPNECIYVLGYYRPSSCAPMQIPGVAISLRGAIYEAAMITGFAVVLPP